MTQYAFEINGPDSGDDLVAALNSFRDAQYSKNKGPTAPTYKVAGMEWIDDTLNPIWLKKVYDGTDWIVVAVINVTTNQAYPLNVGECQNFPLAGGTANALTLTPAVAMTAYTDLDVLTFEAASDNTAAATLNVSGVGAKAIRKMVAGADVALVAGDILDGVRYRGNFDTAANAAAGAWILVSSLLPAGSTIASPTISNATITGLTGYAIAGLLHGLTLSNNGADATNDIDIAIGSAASIDTVPVLMSLTGALTKRLDAAWAVGSGNGGRMSAAAITDTTYHVWLIRRPDTGVVDVGFDVSATSPTMPTNYTQKRRIGSIIREAGAIVAFVQRGDDFRRTAVTDRSSTSAVAASVLTVSVPLGIIVEPIFLSVLSIPASSNVSNQMGSASAGTIEINYQASNTIAAQTHVNRMPFFSGFFTDTSAQIWFAAVIAGGSITSNVLSTYGWIDTRGRVA